MILICCVCVLLYYLFTRNYNYWKLKGVPFEAPSILFGNFTATIFRKQHFFDLFLSIYRRHNSNFVGLYAFNQPCLLLRSPQLVKTVLVKDFDKFANRNSEFDESNDFYAFNDIFSSTEPTWRRLRAQMAPLFTKVRLMPICVRNLSEYLTKHCETMNVRLVVHRYSMDVVSSCAFGLETNCFRQDGDIMKAASKLVGFRSWIRIASMFCFVFLPKIFRVCRLTFTDTEASNSLAAIFKMALANRNGGERHDLIDFLLRNEYKLNDDKMAAQAVSFFVAGNNISSMVAFTLYELALNQQIQHKLRHEVQEILGENGGLTYDNVHKMKYLGMVFCEALRKYPLTTFLTRRSVTKYTFKDTNLTIDEDMLVIIPLCGLHYDPNYFPFPEKFDPERFSQENKHKIKPYTYLPFGAGPRNCLGQKFGVLASKMAIACFIKDFQVVATKETQIPLQYDPSAFFLRNKNGIQLKLLKI